ncbi:acyltransferase family protein [Acinetobacter sp. ANC 4648]|uniref:acyltransferase family protein n=1 Tax=Acinetobacter sp. ANC 4648 TaxID=1977875 RepID=UPI000A3562D0|nr:acyltransferase [Acinetobacter sp. ANC 4648]OTG83802.1 acyltransferase [Acinetobacter sp. ANC 4648]
MQKINSAESIRGLACLAVVFSHLSLSFFPYLHFFDPHDQANNAFIHAVHHSPFAFWYSGTAAVFVFFVLSGFVLSYAIMKNPEQIKDKIKNMLVKRYPRLMIPALTSCLCIWFVFQFIHIDSSHANGWFQAYVTQNFSLKKAIYEGTIGSFFFSESEINWVLWTMTLELLGSFVLFFLIYLYQCKKSLFFIGSIVTLYLIYIWKGEAFSLAISSFVIGIYFYLYGRRLSTSIALLMLILGLYLAGAHNTSYSYAWIYSILGEKTYEYCNFLAGIFIVYSILMSPKLSTLLDHKFFVWLGKVSFSVYLLHLLMIYLVCLPLLNLFLNWGYAYVPSVILASGLCLVVTLAVAELYSRYVDQLAINVSNRLAKIVLEKK